MTKHNPVLLQEVIDCLAPKANENFIDATVGLGGHSEAILSKTGPNGLVFGIDRDQEALNETKNNLKKFGNRFRPYSGNFTEIKDAVKDEPITGILADLGVSSYQLETAKRGFSFRDEAELDMRMDQSQKETAYDIVNNYNQKELADIIALYSDERFAGRIAQNIVDKREEKPISTTTQLSEIVAKSIPRRFWPKRIHPATRTFQAIRIEVNRELTGLEDFLPQARDILTSGGRLAVISFHGLEDEIVRDFFKREANPCECPPEFPTCVCGKKPTLKIITKQPISASDEEIKINPRSRSAKLRVAEKI